MRCLPEGWQFNTTPGILTLTDANTTIGYCRYDGSGEIEYLFVNPSFRRQGVATALLERVLQETGIPLKFQPPLSPLGQALVLAWERGQARNTCT